MDAKHPWKRKCNHLETGHGCLQAFPRDIAGRTLLDDLTLGITGIGALAKPHLHQVVLVGIQQECGHLGGLPHADRQQTAGKRVETSRVARLARTEQLLDLLQCCIGGQACRLVEQQDTVDLALIAVASSHNQSVFVSARPVFTCHIRG